MASPNPYASPQTPQESARDERFVRRYLPLLIAALVIGFVISSFNPILGVPLTLFAMPALVRGTRVYWRKRQAAESISASDWGLLILVSVFAVIPISFVGLITFCCVCTPVGWAAFAVWYPFEGNNLGLVSLYVAMYLGLAAGLSASFLLLRRLNYLSQDEKQALQQAELGEVADDTA